MYVPTSIILILLLGAASGCAGVLHDLQPELPNRDGTDINFRAGPSEYPIDARNNDPTVSNGKLCGDVSIRPQGGPSPSPIGMAPVGGSGSNHSRGDVREHQGVHPVVPCGWVGTNSDRAVLPCVPEPDRDVVVSSPVWRGMCVFGRTYVDEFEDSLGLCIAAFIVVWLCLALIYVSW